MTLKMWPKNKAFVLSKSSRLYLTSQTPAWKKKKEKFEDICILSSTGPVHVDFPFLLSFQDCP